VFNARLNVCKDDSDVIAGGSLFQTFVAATGNARSPIVLCSDRGTCNAGDEAKRRRWREAVSATRSLLVLRPTICSAYMFNASACTYIERPILPSAGVCAQPKKFSRSRNSCAITV